jgi:hypothetical protein
MPTVPDRGTKSFNSEGEPPGPGSTADPKADDDLGPEAIEDAALHAAGEVGVGDAGPSAAGEPGLVDLCETAVEAGQPLAELVGRAALGEFFPEIPGLGEPPPLVEHCQEQLGDMDGPSGRSPGRAIESGQ